MNQVTLQLIGLLVSTSLLVLASPYKPYTEMKEEHMNMQLSDEAVAAYFKNKMEKENLEPAKIVEHVLANIQQGKKSTSDDTKKDVACINQGTSDSLQRAQLEKILDTVHPVTGNPTPFETLITPDHGVTMYTTEFEPLGAYQVMLNTFVIDHIQTGNIWVNYSPCRTCTAALLSHYNKPEDAKPTIHIARVYTETDSLAHAVETLQCLAKLKYEGFDIVSWNFNEFKAASQGGVHTLTDTCMADIDTYYGHTNFTSAYMDLEKHLTFARQLGENPHANSWCTV